MLTSPVRSFWLKTLEHRCDYFLPCQLPMFVLYSTSFQSHHFIRFHSIVKPEMVLSSSSSSVAVVQIVSHQRFFHPDAALGTGRLTRLSLIIRRCVTHACVHSVIRSVALYANFSF